MTPFFLLRPMRSMKKQIFVVLAVLAVIFALPLVAIGSLTNVSALADGALKLFTGNASTNNTYEYGFCTFWAAQRREEIGRAIPNNWGDAHSWDEGASLAEYLVDHTPVVGAIMQSNAGGLGHVAFVEKVNPDGTWEVSEMNVKGWDILSSRTFTAAQAQDYNFIH